MTNDETNSAFPLRPKDKENRELLVKFIEGLIGRATTEILYHSIPQKGLYYSLEEPKDAVYMILTIDKDVNEPIDSVLSGKASYIVMGKKGMEEAEDIQSVRHIAPIIPVVAEAGTVAASSVWFMIASTTAPNCQQCSGPAISFGIVLVKNRRSRANPRT